MRARTLFCSWLHQLCLCLSWAAVKKHHQLSGLHKEHFFATPLEAGTSRMEMPADLVSGESLLPGVWMAIFSLSPHTADSSSLFSSLLGHQSHHAGSTRNLTQTILLTKGLISKHHHIGNKGLNL